ncbi:unnamed protein product [Lampetra planeri]
MKARLLEEPSPPVVRAAGATASPREESRGGSGGSAQAVDVATPSGRRSRRSTRDSERAGERPLFPDPPARPPLLHHHHRRLVPSPRRLPLSRSKWRRGREPRSVPETRISCIAHAAHPSH